MHECRCRTSIAWGGLAHEHAREFMPIWSFEEIYINGTPPDHFEPKIVKIRQ